MGTIRQEMADLLRKHTLDAKEISAILSIREKEVFDHLTHIGRTISAEGGRLGINSCRCLACGYTFKNRRRFSRPGKCPVCRGTRIQPPTYFIRQRS